MKTKRIRNDYNTHTRVYSGRETESVCKAFSKQTNLENENLCSSIIYVNKFKVKCSTYLHTAQSHTHLKTNFVRTLYETTLIFKFTYSAHRSARKFSL